MILRLNLPIATLEEVVEGVVETTKTTKNATLTVRYLQKGRVHLLPSQEVVENSWELSARLVETLRWAKVFASRMLRSVCVTTKISPSKAPEED